jgi:hypothetical protein
METPVRRISLTGYAYALLVGLALAVRGIRVFARSLRMALRLRRLLASLGMIAFAVMFGGSPMALRGGLVMFRGLGMSFLGH